MSTTRTVALWESAVDLQALANNGFNFNIAKSVIDSTGQLKFNMVWQSLGLAPRANISWDVTYCLNWTLNIPTQNAQVVVGGVWQDCAPGQSFDLNKYGLWEASTSGTPKPNFLNVGKNNYAYNGSRGINIIVGVRTPDGNALPIFIDTLQMALGMSSWYQPQEKVQWWYERGTRSSTMISGAQSNVQNWDMTMPRPSDGQYYVSTSYIYATGSWVTNTDNVPNLMRTGALGANTNHVGLTVTPGSNEFDLANLSEELRSLMELLRAAKSGKQGYFATDATITFIGVINWPATTAVAIMTAGLTLILNKLIDKHYSIKTSNKTGDTQYTVEFGPPPGPGPVAMAITDGAGMPGQVQQDWVDAVAADASDGATAGPLKQE